MYPCTTLCALILTGVTAALEVRTLLDTPRKPAHIVSAGKEYEVVNLPSHHKTKRENYLSRPVGAPLTMNSQPAVMTRPLWQKDELFDQHEQKMDRPINYPFPASPSESEKPIKSVTHAKLSSAGRFRNIPFQSRDNVFLNSDDTYTVVGQEKSGLKSSSAEHESSNVESWAKPVRPSSLARPWLRPENNNFDESRNVENFARPVSEAEYSINSDNMARPMRPHDDESEFGIPSGWSNPVSHLSRPVPIQADGNVDASQPVIDMARPAFRPDVEKEVQVNGLTRPAYQPSYVNHMAKPAMWPESESSLNEMARPALRPINSFPQRQDEIIIPSSTKMEPLSFSTDNVAGPPYFLEWSVPVGPDNMARTSKIVLVKTRPGEETEPASVKFTEDNNLDESTRFRFRRQAPEPPSSPGLPGLPGKPGMPGMPGKPGTPGRIEIDEISDRFFRSVEKDTSESKSMKSSLGEQELEALIPPVRYPPGEGYPYFQGFGPSAQAYPGHAVASSSLPRPYGPYPGYPGGYPGGSYPYPGGFYAGGVYPGGIHPYSAQSGYQLGRI